MRVRTCNDLGAFIRDRRNALGMDQAALAQKVAVHGHTRIEAFLRGLLPDNDRVLQSWGKRFQVSTKNVCRLISHVGQDCAGAVQFVLPDRLESLEREAESHKVQWLREEELATRIQKTMHCSWVWAAQSVLRRSMTLRAFCLIRTSNLAAPSWP